MKAYLLKIGFPRITPANLNGSGEIFTPIRMAELKSHVLKFWRPAPKRRKMAAKGWVFCNGTMKLFFVVTGKIGMKFGKKRQSVSSVEPCKNSENFPFRGDFAPKPPFCCCFDGSPCDRPTGHKVTLFDFAKNSIC